MKEIFAARQIEISDRQEQQFQKYYELLVEWNRKINLTAITEYEEVIWKHFIDSAFLVCSSIMTPGKKDDSIRILDLGTGAGFPGMVLAILCPDWQITLVDSLRKRIDFLQFVTEELQLENVRLFHGRAEDYGQDEKFRGQFNFVVSRAVAELPILLEYCIPFVKEKGYFVSYKGKRYEEEIQDSGNAFDKLDCELRRVETYTLSDKEEKRYLLFIQKNHPTDEKYPRKPGKIKKQSL